MLTKQLIRYLPLLFLLTLLGFVPARQAYAAPPTHFSVTPSTASPTAGTPFTITVTALDVTNATDTGYAGTVHFSSSDPQAVLPANYTFTGGDAGVHTFSVTLKTAGSQTITVNDVATPAISGSTTVNVSPAGASHFTVSAPASATAGTPISVTVTAKDAFNNTDTSYTGTVHVTSNDPQATLPADYTFTGGDAGVHTFSVTLKTAGSRTITVTDTVTPSITGTSNSISVAASTAASLTVSAPASATAGTPISVTVTAKDAFNNTATGYAGTVHFTSTDPQATLPANSTLSSGTGTFSVTLKTAGSQTVTATDTATPSITGTSGSINVSPAGANHLVVSAPASTTAGSPISVTVTAKDAFNNTDTGYTGTVHLTATGSSTLPADHTFTGAEAGVHTFTGVILKSAGTQTVTATDVATPTINGSANVSVTAGTATQFTVSAPTTATAGAAFNVTVTAKDPFGNTDTAYGGTVHFTSTDPQAVLPADTTLTAGTGTFSATLKTAGSQTITARDTVNSSIQGTSGNIAVSPAGAASLTLTAPANAGAGSPFNVTVTAHDAFGNVATGYTGTVHFTSSSAGSLPPDFTFTAANAGTKSFSVTLLDAGSQTLTVKDKGNAALTDTDTIVVSAGSTTHFIVTPSTTTPTAGVSFTVTVTAKDAANNTVTGYSGTVHFSSTDAQATLPANSTLSSGTGTFSVTLRTSGAQTVTATDTVSPSITGSANVTVSAAAAGSLTLSAPASTTVGAPFSVTVTARDPFGNVAPSYTGTVQFSSTDPQATLPANYTFTAGDNGTHTFTGGVTLRTHGAQTITVTDTVSGINDSASVTVNPASTTTTLTSSQNPSQFNTAVTFTATVAAVSPATGTPTGTVQFKDGTTNLGAAQPVNGSGQAVLPINTLSVGTHTITAVYTNTDGNFVNSTSNTVTQTITTGSSTVALSSSSSVDSGTGNPTSTFGDAVTFTATVSGSGGTPTGTVQFKDGSANLGAPVTLSGGTASITTSTLTATPPGSPHQIRAVYSGDPNFAGNTSNVVNQQVNSGNGSVVLTASPNPSVFGDPAAGSVTLTATITGSSGVTPTGTVTFNNTFGSSTTPLSGTVSYTSNPGTSTLTAVLTTTPTQLPVGTHSITAHFSSGDLNYQSSDSNTVNQTVDNPAPKNLALSPSSKFAGEADFTLTITGSGFIGTANTPFGGHVVFGGHELANVKFVNTQTLQAPVPANFISTPGSVTVAVSNPDPTVPNPATATFEVKAPASATLLALNPTAIATRSNSFVMKITGQNFQSPVTVNWRFTRNGGNSSTVTSLMPFSVTTSTVLVVVPGHDRPDSLLEDAGQSIVSIINADGTNSNGLSFSISNNPQPAITSLTPATATVGDPGFTMKIAGTNFIQGAQVTFGSTVLDARFDPTDPTGTTLLVDIRQSLISTAGTFNVTVTNPAPNDGSSNPLQFNVFNPGPTISGIAPGFLNVPGTVLLNGATVPGSAQTLTINGTRFAPGMSVKFNGIDVPTTLVSGTQVTAKVDPSLLTTAGLVEIRVTNTQTQTGSSSASVTNFPINPVNALSNFPAPTNNARNLRMFSVPYDYTGVSPYAILAGVTLNPTLVGGVYDPQSNILTGISDFSNPTQPFMSLFHWDPVSLKYVKASPPPAIDLQLNLGQSYWAVGSANSNPFGVMRLGTPANVNPFPINLEPGWNMVGNPFPKDLLLNNLQVLVNGSVIALYPTGPNGSNGSAVGFGFVSPVLWSWDGSVYQPNYAGKSADIRTDVLKSYEGYWLFSTQKCSLLVTNQ